MFKRKVFIYGKVEYEIHEEAISSKEDNRLIGNIMKEKYPRMWQFKVVDLQVLLSFPTLIINENSLYHCSSLNSDVLSSDRLFNATIDGSRAVLHDSNDVSSKEKCLIGSSLNGFGNDPFGMNVMFSTINIKSLVVGKSSSVSLTNNVAWKMYLDGIESIPLLVHGQKRMHICTFGVSQFHQNPSYSFSYISQKMIH